MTFSVGYSDQFLAEWGNFQEDQREHVGVFIEIVQTHGLADQTKLPGRISPSWHRLPPNDPQAVYAKANSLWHYHIGLPGYSGTQSWGKTSDWLLHFQWANGSTHVDLVDLYTHHNWRGQFYMPGPDSLV